MTICVGIDLVGTEQVADSLRAFGPRYLNRVFTDDELHDCGSSIPALAACFAAKEATMKALGRDDEPLPWRSIAVVRDPAGRPQISLSGAAAQLAQRRGVTALSVSLTHERSTAGAVVLGRRHER